jgi:hypothetical protein
MAGSSVPLTREQHETVHTLGPWSIFFIICQLYSHLFLLRKVGSSQIVQTQCYGISQRVDIHISLFPYIVSHYGRTKSKKRYFRSDLSVMNVYVCIWRSTSPKCRHWRNLTSRRHIYQHLWATISILNISNKILIIVFDALNVLN